MPGRASHVSTSTTRDPLSAAWRIGAYSARSSAGATRIASGCSATTALRIGVCSEASSWSGALKERSAPAASAASCAPQRSAA